MLETLPPIEIVVEEVGTLRRRQENCPSDCETVCWGECAADDLADPSTHIRRLMDRQQRSNMLQIMKTREQVIAKPKKQALTATILGPHWPKGSKLAPLSFQLSPRPADWLV